MPRTGRRPGGSDTRSRIEFVARQAFGELGYDGATIREIARRAGVDAALVHHYYGTKQRLFLSVMNLPFDVRSVMADVSGSGPEGLGTRLVSAFLELWDEQPGARAVMSGIVRSATTDPQAAGLMREFLGRQGLFEIIGSIAADRPDLRTVLVGTQLIGLALARYIVRIEPVASADRAALAAAIGPTIERYLLGPIDPS